MDLHYYLHNQDKITNLQVQIRQFKHYNKWIKHAIYTAMQVVKFMETMCITYLETLEKHTIQYNYNLCPEV